MTLRILHCVSVVLLMALSACEKKEEAPTPPAVVETAASAPATAPAAAPVVAKTIDLSEVPVEEEFEEAVEKEITAANLEQKLASVEKEMQGE